jgi:hypothetical protein
MALNSIKNHLDTEFDASKPFCRIYKHLFNEPANVLIRQYFYPECKLDGGW